MTVNTDDGNKFPVTIIQKAMKECKYQINQNKPAKPNALKFIEAMQQDSILPIKRPRTRLCLTLKN
jgi:ribosome maturation protein Sdo1